MRIQHPKPRVDSETTKADFGVVQKKQTADLPGNNPSKIFARQNIEDLGLIFAYVFLNRIAYHATQNRSPYVKSFLQAGVFCVSIIFRMALFGCALWFATAMESLNLIFQGDRNNHHLRRAVAAAICLPGFIQFWSAQEASGQSGLEVYFYHAMKLAAKCAVVFVAERGGDCMQALFHKARRREKRKPVVPVVKAPDLR